MKQHFVPIFYLNKWVDQNDNKVQYFKRVNGRFISGRIAPKNTAFEIDLNALKFVPEEDIHQIEQFFSKKIDSPGAEVLKN